jgi:hypothetical protein
MMFIDRIDIDVFPCLVKRHTTFSPPEGIAISDGASIGWRSGATSSIRPTLDLHLLFAFSATPSEHSF